MSGEEIRKLRQEKGLTLKELAEITGLDASTISKVETGTRNPQKTTLKLIVEALEKADYKDKNKELDKIKENKNVFLTKEEGEYFRKIITSKGFSISNIAYYVLKDRKLTISRKKDVLSRMLKGEYKMSKVEKERLEFFENCFIISSERYAELMLKAKKLNKITNIIDEESGEL